MASAYDAQTAGPPCPVCSTRSRRHDGFSSFLNLPDNTGIRVNECAGCGMMFLHPYLTEEQLADLYSEAYFDSTVTPSTSLGSGAVDESYESFARKRLQKFEWSLDLLAQFHPSASSILDVGAATGEFLEIARRRGMDVEGIEFSAVAAERARAQFGFSFFRGKLEDFVAHRTFDIIHLNHVLEHLVEPHVVLRRIDELLAPDGVVYIEVPFQYNWVEQAKARLSGAKQEFNLFSLHHPVFYRPNTLQQLFQRHGFSCVHLSTFDPRRYPQAGPASLAKLWAWRALAMMGQGNYIEAVFARSNRVQNIS